MNNNLFTSLNLHQHHFPSLINMNMSIFSINLTSEFILTSTIIIGLTISGSIIYYYLNLPRATEGEGEKDLKALAKEPSVSSDSDTITSTDSAIKNVVDQNVGTSSISPPCADTNNSSNLSSNEVLRDPLSVKTKVSSTENTSAQIREVADVNIGTSSIVNKEHLDQNINTTSTLTSDTSTSAEQTLRTVLDQTVDISQQLAIISDQNVDTISNLASTIIEYLL
jgi:hypothetical protein